MVGVSLVHHLKDENIADTKALEELSGVMGVAKGNNQYQVIVGQDVESIYDELVALLPNQKNDQDETPKEGFKDQKTFSDKFKYGFNAVIGIVTGAVMPIIHILAASIGSAVGGFFTGLLEVNMWSIIGSIIGLPSYIDPVNGVNANFWYAVGITILTLAVSFLITYFWGYNDEMKMHERKEKPVNPGKVSPQS